MNSQFNRQRYPSSTRVITQAIPDHSPCWSCMHITGLILGIVFALAILCAGIFLFYVEFCIPELPSVLVTSVSTAVRSVFDDENNSITVDLNVSFVVEYKVAGIGGTGMIFDHLVATVSQHKLKHYHAKNSPFELGVDDMSSNKTVWFRLKNVTLRVHGWDRVGINEDYDVDGMHGQKTRFSYVDFALTGNATYRGNNKANWSKHRIPMDVECHHVKMYLCFGTTMKTVVHFNKSVKGFRENCVNEGLWDQYIVLFFISGILLYVLGMMIVFHICSHWC